MRKRKEIRCICSRPVKSFTAARSQSLRNSLDFKKINKTVVYRAFLGFGSGSAAFYRTCYCTISRPILYILRISLLKKQLTVVTPFSGPHWITELDVLYFKISNSKIRTRRIIINHFHRPLGMTKIINWDHYISILKFSATRKPVGKIIL